MTRIISIEGNIGSGKSTFVKELQSYYKSNSENLKIHFLQEPVDIWNNVQNTEGKNIIECYYTNQEKYAFPFQMMAYISRIHLLKEALKDDYDIIITERCVHTDKNVFAQMLYDECKIGEIEFKIYNMWFHEFLKDLPKIDIVYLKTNPNISNERVIKRSRKGENIPIAYLEKCHNYHEKWLEQDAPIITIDGNEDIQDYGNYLKKLDIMALKINNINEDINKDINEDNNKENNQDSNEDKKEYTLYFDGASRGNPGHSGLGFLVYKNNNEIYKCCKYIGEKYTNNFAEYMAVYEGLKWCFENKINNLSIKGDSQLVIKQLKGEYKVNSENLQELYDNCSKLLKLFDNYELYHIDRKLNSRADKLANISIDSLST
jgi:ribonuclease HI/deoxyadenosine/deoxycytidine kinase